MKSAVAERVKVLVEVWVEASADLSRTTRLSRLTNSSAIATSAAAVDCSRLARLTGSNNNAAGAPSGLSWLTYTSAKASAVSSFTAAVY